MRPTTRFIVAAGLTIALAVGDVWAQPAPQHLTTQRPGDIVASESTVIPADEGVAQGRVVDDRTGLPVAQASVLLVPTFVPGREKRGVTDDRGRYQIRGLTPGKYSVFGEAEGYLPRRGGSRYSLETQTSVEIRGGRVTTGVRVRLHEAAVISGRVFDADGNGFPAVQVDILGFGVTNRVRATAKTAWTDERGEFRVDDLQPGNYVVKAIPSGALQRPDPDRPEVYTATLYPATTRMVEAQPLRVTAGEELFGIDFGLMTVEPVELTGVVLDSTGVALEGVRINLQWRASPPATVGMTTSDAKGEFHLTGIIPDDYLLTVEQATRGRLQRPLERDEAWSGLEIRFPGTTTVDGRIRHDGVGPLPFDPTRIGIMAFTVLDRSAFISGQVSSNMGGAQVRPDGTFTIENLAVPAQLMLRGAPQDWATKELRVDGVVVTHERTHVRGDATEIEFIVTDQVTEVVGVVTDEDGRTVADCTVVVFPASPDLRDRIAGPDAFVRGIRPNQAGRFSITRLPPTDYLAIAVAGLRENAWTDPEVLNRLWSDATPFRIEHAEHHVLRLDLSPKPSGL